MLVSAKWLREYVNFPMTVAELGERLTMVGLELEGLEERPTNLQQVVTARVEMIGKHPRADRLQLCEVTTGNQIYQIVCGAPNVAVSAVVALALPGAKLHAGISIQETTVRGERSQGMLCSQRELGLGEDASGIWLLPPDTPIGTPLAEALGFNDTVLDISVTPNRSDCLSIVGIAREVAAICGMRLQYPVITCDESGPPVDALGSVTIDDPVGCPRYAARIIEGIRIGPSPEWLQQRLESSGIRSINNIVDVTNYILLELGQPLHAFDFDRLAEHRILVRRAQDGERFTTLDGNERNLYEDTLLICDGRQPVAIAGVMGGLNSEITGETSRVLIESAFFQPQGIRRTSKKLGLRTESSYRFERGVDLEGVTRALDRAAQLMLEVGGGQLAGGRIDVYPAPISQPILTFAADRTNRFLGTQLTSAQMAKVLTSIEMQVEPLDDNRLKVVPPSFRQDVSREVDLMEEIARLAGYDSIPSTCPQASVFSNVPDDHLTTRETLRNILAGFGFAETITYSFVSLDSLEQLRLPSEDRRVRPLKLANPLSEDQAVMRTSLIPGLLATARRNFDYRNLDLRIYELSKVFLATEKEQPEEHYFLAGLMTGLRQPQRLYGGEDKIEYADVKGVVEALLGLLHIDGCRFRQEALEPYLDPWGSAAVFCGDHRLGTLGRLHPEVERECDLKAPVFVLELDFDRLFGLRRSRPLYQALPKFPSVTRDMALVLDDNLAVQSPMDYIMEQCPPMLEHVAVFDLYRDPQLGKGKKSVGYRLVYRAPDRSLTDEEVNDIHTEVVRKVLRTFGAAVR
ncbi:MAG TPA: phenylalanine--tRNA ligase subunit beta [Syntrophobacteraceae bacterium]|nr:phenylalanine--tRNA ligase subunit beta [Syntrophobacteraceae bacterium]